MLVLLIAGGILLPWIAKSTVEHVLETLGYKTEILEIEQLDLDSLIMGKLSARNRSNDGRLQLSNVVVSYDPAQLYRGAGVDRAMLDSIAINNISLDIDLTTGGTFSRERALSSLGLPDHILDAIPVKQFEVNNIALTLHNKDRQLKFSGYSKFKDGKLGAYFLEELPPLASDRIPLFASFSLSRDNLFELKLALEKDGRKIFSQSTSGIIRTDSPITIRGQSVIHASSHEQLYESSSLVTFLGIHHNRYKLSDISSSFDFLYNDSTGVTNFSNGEASFRYEGKDYVIHSKTTGLEAKHSVETEQLDFSGRAQIHFRSDTRNTELKLTEDFSGTVHTGNFVMRGEASGLVTLIESPLALSLYPFRNHSSFELKGGTARFKTDLRDQNRFVHVAASGQQDFDAARGEVNIELKPVSFSQYNGIQKIIRDWSLPLDIDQGIIKCVSSFNWHHLDTSGELACDTRELQVIVQNDLYGASSVTGLDTGFKLAFRDFNVEAINPLEISADHLQLDILSLEDFHVLVVPEVSSPLEGGSPISSFVIENLSTSMLDGSLNLHQARYVTGEASLFELRLSDLSLREILSLYGDRNLSGSGKISGTLPVKLASGEISIRDGHIGAEGPGVIRYAPSELSATIASTNMQSALLMATLEEYRYSKLESSIDYEPSGRLLLGVRIHGQNTRPTRFIANGVEVELPANQLVNLNPRLSFNLLDLLVSLEHNDYSYMSNRLGGRLVREIEQMLERKQPDQQ